jgi:hypothetical protein
MKVWPRAVRLALVTGVARGGGIRGVGRPNDFGGRVLAVLPRIEAERRNPRE